MNWQTIDTAPKDGTPILAICSHALAPQAMIVHWDPASRAAWPLYINDYDGDEESLGWLSSATHWQPLPEPPEVGA